MAGSNTQKLGLALREMPDDYLQSSPEWDAHMIATEKAEAQLMEKEAQREQHYQDEMSNFIYPWFESIEDSEEYDPFSEEHLEYLIRHESGDKIMKATVYSTKNCPNCSVLKELLKKEGIDVEEADMRTPDVATELFAHNVFAMQAPILRMGDEFHTGLSPMGRLDVEKVKSILARRIEGGQK